ncbi:hypothetical protein E1264_28960 [Actinomadura sp. KC216]|uniref:hypothetical protein n=1 Tax=Actinomadura sp. KC216 TaxID=2530370 RepID=UPI001048367B|nr:hypothetical protein [Actinomadura sp. KC216]TDB83302.1 hypothetical protein E1264_28960 [Actinomadura sp. KC216]
MARVKREHDGHDEAADAEVLSSMEYAAELRDDSSGRSFGAASCGAPAEGLEQHICMGLNACKAFDVDGAATMAGTGNCATVRHVCHGEGQCRGQGGCGYAGSDEQQWRPGEQACRFNGSCASPVNISRVFSGGPMKGKSVWLQARRIMEDRMYRAGLAYGPAPAEGIPDDMLPEYDVDDGRDLPDPRSNGQRKSTARASASRASASRTRTAGARRKGAAGKKR